MGSEVPETAAVVVGDGGPPLQGHTAIITAVTVTIISPYSSPLSTVHKTLIGREGGSTGEGRLLGLTGAP